MKKVVVLLMFLMAALLLCGACGKKQEVKTIEGEYIGLIDANFIEIKISGVPEENAHVSFMLSEEVRPLFEELQLNSGELIRFDYRMPEEGAPVILHIERVV